TATSSSGTTPRPASGARAPTTDLYGHETRVRRNTTMRMSRRLITAVQIGALGVALVAGGAASCTPDDYPVVGGNESTGQVCTDLGNQLPPIVGGLVASPLILAMDTDTTPDHQAQQVKATRASFGQLSDALRAEAAKAADPDLAAALGDTASG